MTNLYYPQKIQPCESVILIKGKAIKVLEVIVEGKDYDVCDNFSKAMWANKKKGKWGSGLINSEEDERKAERTGLLGEIAFAKIFGFPIDIEYCKGGKSNDFLSCVNTKDGITIDIKTAARRPKYNAGLVRCTNGWGKPAKLSADIYVFGYVESEDRRNKLSKLIMVGWDYKTNIMKHKKNRAKMGNHYNYEVEYLRLIPIQFLGEVIK
jgi:hypothetical protein